MGHQYEAASAALYEQHRVLRRVAELLAAAQNFQETLRQTLAGCLPALGDFGFFDVVTDSGVQRTSAAHDAPDIAAILAPTGWVRQVRDDGMNLCALSTGAAAVHPEIDDGWYRRVAAGDEHLRVLRELAFRSMITVPVRYRQELLGSLTLFMGRSGRRHSAEDLEFAEELALLVAPVVANARLLEQHQRAEAALRVGEERLRMALQAGRVGTWDWDISTNRVEWSDRVYEMHGMTPGSDTGGLEGFQARVHPEDFERVSMALRTALEGGPPYEVEFRTRLPDGRIRWIATRSELVRDGDGRAQRMVGASIDITERMELLAAERGARAEAEAARKRLELLSSAGHALARSLDPDDTLQTIARTVVPAIADWCRIDLLDDDGVLQRKVAYHQDPAVSRKALEMAKVMRAAPQATGSMGWCILHGRSHHGTFENSTDPALRLFTQTFDMREHFILPLVARGRTIGAMGVLQAESGRTLTEEDRSLIETLAQRAGLALDNARLYAEAEAARRQAEAASRAKDEFLAMLGHELRNPLAPIAAALDLMARRDRDAHVEERKVLSRQVAHLSRLIDDLLDVSRITQGKVELQRVPIDMRTVVSNAVEQTQPLFERRDKGLDLALPSEPVMVEGDAVRLTQVLCNLLVNADKFTPADRRVSLSLNVANGWMSIAVEDEGRGIAAQLLPEVFDLFVQGRQALDRRSGGLGLGLAIVRMIVELHGGHVSAQSEGEGRGSRFIVQLPLSASPPSEAAGEVAQDVTDGERAAGRILVVDDNVDAAETLADLLRVMGYEVRCASHGEAALQVLGEFDAQVGLFDIGLPGMDGYELASRVRGLQRGTPIKLVALTGYGSEDDRARALAARFDEHLVKPVNLERLMAVLKTAG